MNYPDSDDYYMHWYSNLKSILDQHIELAIQQMTKKNIQYNIFAHKKMMLNFCFQRTLFV